MTEHDGLKRSKTELLPCPFCGGEAVIRVDATRLASYRDRLRVGCETAGCRGFYHAAWAYYETPEQAAEAWNTRAQQGTCRNVSYRIDESRFHCSECKFGCWVKDVSDGCDKLPKFCPNCGRKVVV